MARPSKFNIALSEKMIELYNKGKTDRQVAEIIGVSERTITNWKASNPGFLLSLKEAKQGADDLVEASLFSRAIGYTNPEEKIFCDKDGNIIRAPTLKHYAPDVTAQIFWLKNRRPELWRDKIEISNEDDQAKEVEAIPIKKSFEEFCVTAGYPKPFPKQIEMQKFGMEQGAPRLLLGARGYGKTEYITILGLAYDIYLSPDDNTNLIITKSKARNAAIMEEISNALTKNGVNLDKSNSTVIRLSNLLGQNHSVEAITIKTSMRGRHPKRIIMDDPVTDEDTSEAMRVLVKKKYDEAYKLCKNILIIGQPAHKFDLYAELRPKLQTMLVPHGTIPELDADLEAMRLAGVDENSILMSFKLIVPTSGSTPFDNVKYMDNFPIGDSAVAFIDPSFEGGDYTAITILRQHMQGVAIVGFCFKKAWNHCIDDLVPIINKYKVQKLAFETNALGDMPVGLLRQALPKVGVVGRRSNTNKHSRIMAAGAFSHMIHLSKEGHSLYNKQVAEYEYKAKHDDCPDSLASCLEWIGLIRGKV